MTERQDLPAIYQGFSDEGNRYPENQPVPPERQYTASEPDADIQELRKQAAEILKKQYDEVDDTGDKSISIFNKALNRKVDVVFCFWYRSNKYDETQNEYYNVRR